MQTAEANWLLGTMPQEPQLPIIKKAVEGKGKGGVSLPYARYALWN